MCVQWAHVLSTEAKNICVVTFECKRFECGSSKHAFTQININVLVEKTASQRDGSSQNLRFWMSSKDTHIHIVILNYSNPYIIIPDANLPNIFPLIFFLHF